MGIVVGCLNAPGRRIAAVGHRRRSYGTPGPIRSPGAQEIWPVEGDSDRVHLMGAREVHACLRPGAFWTYKRDHEYTA